MARERRGHWGGARPRPAGHTCENKCTFSLQDLGKLLEGFSKAGAEPDFYSTLGAGARNKRRRVRVAAARSGRAADRALGTHLT